MRMTKGLDQGKITVGLIILLLLFNCRLEAGIYNKEGKPFTQIIVAPDAPSTVKLAAKELQKFLKEACKADLSIAGNVTTGGLPIFVGQSDGLAKLNLSAQDFDVDEFRVVCDGKMLAIFGNDYNGPPIGGLRTGMQWFWNPKLKLGTLGSVGTLFGVYDFLEQVCGIRWYMPGPLGTVIPEKEKLIIPDSDYSKHPAFAYRFVYLRELSCWNPEQIANAEESVLWYRRLGFGGAPNIEINHSFCLFSKYIKTNPDYFALVDGERDFGNKCVKYGGGPQLCLTNPKVVDQWVNDICEHFSKHPEEGCYPLAPGDGLKRVCECPGCQAEVVQKNVPGATGSPNDGMYSNHIWGFVNRVAEKVALKYPDKYIGNIAYDTWSAPPDFKLHPNVVLMFCKTSCLNVDPAYKKTIRDQIAAWQKQTSNLYFWDYYLAHWMPWTDLPVVYPHTIKEEIQYMRNIRSGGEKIEAERHPAYGQDKIGHRGMQHLNLYVTGKLQWDPDLDIDNLLEEYFNLFYGPAHNEMSEFWLHSEKLYADAGAKHHIGKNHVEKPMPGWVFTVEALNKLDSLLNGAIFRTEPDSVYRKRIEIIQKEFTLGKNRLISAASLKPQELVLDGPAKILNGEVSYSKPVKMRANLDNSEVSPERDTRMSLAWDKTNLYLKCVCFDEDIKNVKTESQNRDDESIWRDDCVNIFICPNPEDLSLCYQVIVTAAGTVGDGKYSKPDNASVPDFKWQSGIKAKSRMDSDRWTIEAQIPLIDLGLDGDNLSGKSIIANVYRNQQSKDGTRYFAWSPTGKIEHLYPEGFGRIRFESSK